MYAAEKYELTNIHLVHLTGYNVFLFSLTFRSKSFLIYNHGFFIFLNSTLKEVSKVEVILFRILISFLSITTFSITPLMAY